MIPWIFRTFLKSVSAKNSQTFKKKRKFVHKVWMIVTLFSSDNCNINHLKSCRHRHICVQALLVHFVLLNLGLNWASFGCAPRLWSLCMSSFRDMLLFWDEAFNAYLLQNIMVWTGYHFCHMWPPFPHLLCSERLRHDRRCDFAQMRLLLLLQSHTFVQLGPAKSDLFPKQSRREDLYGAELLFRRIRRFLHP